MTINIEIKDITGTLSEYRDRVDMFLLSLGPEKRFFNLTVDRVMKAELMMLVLFDNEIIGLGGLERKLGISRSIIILQHNSQGKGIGKMFHMKIIGIAKQKHDLILGVIEQENIQSIRMDLSLGYRLAGKRGNLYYLFCPLNTKGNLMYYCIKTIFPIINMIDKLRH